MSLPLSLPADGPFPGRRTASAPRKRKAYRLGVGAEAQASLLLSSKGYRILGRRVRLSPVEIDLVAARHGTVAFVEVKARDTVERAIEAVGPALQRRIVRAGADWLSRNPDYADHVLRFDIVAIAPGRLPRHIPNAFWEVS